MRALIFVAGVLALAACSNNDQRDNTMNIDENLTAENIVSNDVTAIDAVTGDAANMAADVQFNDVANTTPADENPGAPPQQRTKSITAPKSSTPTKPETDSPGNKVSNAE